MRAFRKATPLGSALCLLAGVTLSPFVSVHVFESHGPGPGPGHHVADYASLQRLGHSHGDHDHPVLAVASNGISYRHDSQFGGPSVDAILIRPLKSWTTTGLAHALTPKPPRSRHPLSLSNTLRI